MDTGAKAQRILDDELVKAARKRCEDWILENFKTAPHRDNEGVLELKRLWATQQRFFNFFEECIRGGESAERHLDAKRKGLTTFLGDVWPSRRPR